jgi:Molybdopterin-binding domain of aldehyde dehydrogenase
LTESRFAWSGDDVFRGCFSAVCVGNADAAFAAAAIVTRGCYSVPRYTGIPLEPRGVVADYAAEAGRLTVWSSDTMARNSLSKASQPIGGVAVGLRSRISGVYSPHRTLPLA